MDGRRFGARSDLRSVSSEGHGPGSSSLMLRCAGLITTIELSVLDNHLNWCARGDGVLWRERAGWG